MESMETTERMQRSEERTGESAPDTAAIDEQVRALTKAYGQGLKDMAAIMTQERAGA